MVFVTSLFSLMCASRFWEVMAFFWSIFAMLVTCVRPLSVPPLGAHGLTPPPSCPRQISWIFEIVAFTIVKNRLSSETDGQLTGTLGNALWMHLAAAVVLLCVPCRRLCASPHAALPRACLTRRLPSSLSQVHNVLHVLWHVRHLPPAAARPGRRRLRRAVAVAVPEAGLAPALPAPAAGHSDVLSALCPGPQPSTRPPSFHRLHATSPRHASL